jgi:D-threonate/D-erythronate kinase
MHLIIVADDLTGAADTAARAFAAGLPATLFLEPVPPPWSPGAVAFSSDSRYLSPAAAARQVRTLVASLRGPTAVWYKKVDSTLRGNIGAELDAILSALAQPQQPAVAVICPAFPAQGRGLVGGMLEWAGRDGPPLYLPALIAGETVRPVALVPLEIVRKGAAALGMALQTAAAQGAQILVVDGLNDSDLATVAAATQTALPHALLCGSAGLIEPLARSLVTPDLAASRPHPLHVHPPLLAVVGSGSTMAHRQVAALRDERDILVTELDPTGVAQVEREWKDKRGVVLHLPKPDADTPLEGERARSLAAILAETAMRLADRLQPRLILLVGGDTTVHTLERLGIHRLNVLAELMPGIPLLEGVAGDGERTMVVTKAGSFGDERTLVRLIELLDGELHP